MKTFPALRSNSLNRSKSHAIIRLWFLNRTQFLLLCYLRTRLITLLSETFVFVYHVQLLVSFLERELYIFEQSFCVLPSPISKEVIKLFVFRSMFRHVYRQGFRVRGNAVQLVITRAWQVWIAPGNVIYDENFLNERSIPSVRCKISFRNVSSPFFPSIVPHFSGQLRTCYDPLTIGYIPQEI